MDANMPIYEYRCGACQTVSNFLVYSWSADKALQCKQCGGPDMQRLMSGFSFRPSWGDSLNWAPSRETMSDVNEDSAAGIDQYMGRIQQEMGGQTTPDFDRMRREMTNMDKQDGQD
jgi:putative FmdB family regulatory protein